ncbi:hypothetical protein MG3_05408 [Candida albicans P78048]|uniref:Uncharacterized protein n=1 Tax=Candida albicans P78048 TaxID=1094989 RepID=A0AB34PJW9_CANAX|nr:hypothetical protein MG3_05408 [Candida albicans P78048]
MRIERANWQLHVYTPKIPFYIPHIILSTLQVYAKALKLLLITNMDVLYRHFIFLYYTTDQFNFVTLFFLFSEFPIIFQRKSRSNNNQSISSMVGLIYSTISSLTPVMLLWL